MESAITQNFMKFMLRNCAEMNHSSFRDDDLFGPTTMSLTRSVPYPFTLSPIKSCDEASSRSPYDEDTGSSMPTLVAAEPSITSSHASYTSGPATTYEMVIGQFNLRMTEIPSPPRRESCFRHACKCFFA